MQKKLWIKWLSLLLVTFTLAGCQNKPADQETTESVTQESVTETLSETESREADKSSQSEAQEVEVRIEIMADDKEVVPAKTIMVTEGSILLDVMKDNYDIEEDKGFITTIEGQSQDPDANKWWLFNLNDEMAQVGAGELELQAGDKISWDLSVLE